MLLTLAPSSYCVSIGDQRLRLWSGEVTTEDGPKDVKAVVLIVPFFTRDAQMILDELRSATGEDQMITLDVAARSMLGSSALGKPPEAR